LWLHVNCVVVFNIIKTNVKVKFVVNLHWKMVCKEDISVTLTISFLISKIKMIKTVFDSSLPLVVCRRAHVICVCLHIVVSNTLCCVFVLFFFVSCTLCCQFLWIVHFWLALRYSLMLIYHKHWPWHWLCLPVSPFLPGRLRLEKIFLNQQFLQLLQAFPLGSPNQCYKVMKNMNKNKIFKVRDNILSS